MDAPILAFPTPFPGEFFGGILLRYHGLYGARSLPQTLCGTLGLGRGAVRNLPTRLGHFAEQTGSVWPGGVDTILEEHTVWPVYRPFLTRHGWSHAYKRIVEGPAGSLQLTLGDATARLKLQRHLQACPDCAAEDTAHYGQGYFHTDHQLPGVTVCHLHESRLFSVPVPTGQGRFHVAPSAGRPISRVPDPGEVEFASLSVALRVAHVPRLKPKLIALAYVERLRVLGLLTTKGNVRCQALARAVMDRYPETLISRLGVSGAAVEGWMPGMLHRLQRGHHPVKHLLYIGTLFGNLESFLEALSQRELLFNASPPPARKRDIGAEVNAELARGSSTMSSMGKRLGLSTTTCITYAKRAGAKLKARPKTLRSAKLKRLTRKIASGASIARICNSEEVSVASVYRAIKADKTLEQVRKAAVENKLRKKHRAVWKQQIRHRTKTSSVARRGAPSVYAWLYRHDRDWLMRGARRNHIHRKLQH